MSTRTLKSRVTIYTVLTILAALMVIPFFWMLFASFKNSNEVFSIPMRILPETWRYQNYQEIWKKIPLLTFFKTVSYTHLTLPTILRV